MSGRRARPVAEHQRVEHGLRVGKPLFGIDREAPFDDLGQPPVDSRRRAQGQRLGTGPKAVPINGQLRFEIGGGPNRLLDLTRAIGRFPAQHVIEEGPQRVNVPPRIGDGMQVGLFRRHVKHGSERRVLLVRQSRLPEITQPRLEVIVQQNVRRFQVAVQYPAAMRDEPAPLRRSLRSARPRAAARARNPETRPESHGHRYSIT